MLIKLNQYIEHLEIIYNS